MSQTAGRDVVHLSMGAPGGREAFAQPHLATPRSDAATAKDKPRTDVDMFASYFWAVPIGAQQNATCNMKVAFEDVKITSMEVKVPIMTNTSPLDVGDHL
eukprot:7741575-Pyramimonas_sp.AAC.1